MSTRRLDDLLPQVMVHATSCPTVYALQCLRRAAIEWCEKTRCWRHAAEIEVTAQDEPIEVPAYASIFEIEKAEWNGKRLDPVPFNQVTHDDRNNGGRGLPYGITQATPGSLMLVPFQPGKVSLSLFLKPKHGTSYELGGENAFRDTLNVIPAHLFDQDADHIAAGGLQRILATPGKDWTNLELAVWFAGEFEKAIGERAARHARGQQRAPMRTNASWF